ncbi:MAG: amidase [Bosea sp. (in: a-proteobacteria)]
METPLNHRSARAIGDGIQQRQISAEQVMAACLEAVAVQESKLGAWAFLDPDLALSRARLADRMQAEGLPLGPLHGVPVGVKDVFDTCDMPSEYGSAFHSGRRPGLDAAVVTHLRRSGAIIMGKTTTSEFGMYHQSKARNPHDPTRSAGVSSSGSAVAVTAHMVPLAIGTQHTASTLLPAAFCGCVGFKPSFGFADMCGSNILVPRLAQLGLLARDVGDIALLADVFREQVEAPPPRRPIIGVLRGPVAKVAPPDVLKCFDAWVAELPIDHVDVALPVIFEEAFEMVMTLLDAHLARRFGDVDSASFEAFCGPLQECIQRGKAVTASAYLAANQRADEMTEAADKLLCEFDALVTLAAPTEATPICEGPGSGVLTMPWSLCGLPTISLPALKGPTGLPLGVQLVGQRSGDGHLLDIARHISAAVLATAP